MQSNDKRILAAQIGVIGKSCLTFSGAIQPVRTGSHEPVPKLSKPVPKIQEIDW